MNDAYIRHSAAIGLIRRHIGDLQTSREESLIAWVISTLRTMPAADVAPFAAETGGKEKMDDT